MPKIKNWSKTSKSSWENDKTGDKIYTLSTKNVRTGEKEYKLVGTDSRKQFDTKQDAIDYAVKWMKRNPNP